MCVATDICFECPGSGWPSADQYCRLGLAVARKRTQLAVEPTMGQRKGKPLFVEPQYEPMETVITPKSLGMIAALPQWP